MDGTIAVVVDKTTDIETNEDHLMVAEGEPHYGVRPVEE